MNWDQALALSGNSMLKSWQSSALVRPSGMPFESCRLEINRRLCGGRLGGTRVRLGLYYQSPRRALLAATLGQ